MCVDVWFNTYISFAHSSTAAVLAMLPTQNKRKYVYRQELRGLVGSNAFPCDAGSEPSLSKQSIAQSREQHSTAPLGESIIRSDFLFFYHTSILFSLSRIESYPCHFFPRLLNNTEYLVLRTSYFEVPGKRESKTRADTTTYM